MLINFDYDGVLVDTFDHWLGIMRAAHRETGCGRPTTREDLETTESITFDHLGRQCGVDEDDLPRFVETVYQLQSRSDAPQPLYPGIPEVLQGLSARHTVTIVTSNLASSVQRLLQYHSLDRTVTRILDGRAAGAKSDKIASLCRTFDAPPQESFMVGDAISDIRQGKRAGVRAIAVAWGFQRRDLLLAETPDFVADEPEDLLEILS